MAGSANYPKRDVALRVGFTGFWEMFKEEHVATVIAVGEQTARRIAWEAFHAGAAVQLALAADVILQDPRLTHVG